MRLLLDTQVLLWGLREPGRVGPRALAAMDRAELAYVSVISFAEIGIKVAIGKLRAPPGISEHVPPRRVLALTPEHGLAVAALPLHHRDPFDRLLVAQALTEGLTIVTSDAEIARYDVPVINAIT